MTGYLEYTMARQNPAVAYRSMVLITTLAVQLQGRKLNADTVPLSHYTLATGFQGAESRPITLSQKERLSRQEFS